MKIVSRPAVKQNCKDIVQKSLLRMIVGPNKITNPLQVIQTMPGFEKEINLIFNALSVAGVLTSYKIEQARETKNSTYEHEEWMVRIHFTDDPTYKVGYVADLHFKFNR